MKGECSRSSSTFCEPESELTTTKRILRNNLAEGQSSQALPQGNCSLQRAQHAFDNITIDNFAANSRQVINCLRIRRIRLQTAVLPRRHVNAELLFWIITGANLIGIRAALNAYTNLCPALFVER